MAHHEETHITVAGNDAATIRRWQDFCRAHAIKPLFIELNTFERQLMCAIRTHGVVEWWVKRVAEHFEIVRVKQEVQPYKLDITCHGDDGKKWLDCPNPELVIYYELHAKFDGPFRPSWRMSSRDLLREGRWYATYRSEKPFDAKAQVEMFSAWAALPDGWRGPSVLAGWEYEAAILDTNPELDAHWSAWIR